MLRNFYDILFLLIFFKFNFQNFLQIVQIRPDILLDLIWFQTVCKGYQQTTLVDKEQMRRLACVVRKPSKTGFLWSRLILYSYHPMQPTSQELADNHTLICISTKVLALYLLAVSFALCSLQTVWTQISQTESRA